MNRPKHLTVLIFTLFLLAASTGFATGLKAVEDPQTELMVPTTKLPPSHVQQILDALLFDYDVFELDPQLIDRQVRSQGRLRLHLGNQTFDLELEPHDLRAPGYREVMMMGDREVVLPERPLSTFKGRVAGDPASVVRFSVLPDRFEGYIKTEEDWVFIDPLSNYDLRSRSGDVVLYREGDVRPGAAGACGVQHVLEEAERLGVSAAPLTHLGAGSHQRRNVQIATDGDGQLTQRYGNPGVFDFMSGVLSRVDGIYGGQLNLDATIVYQQAWSNPSTDPYTSLDASTTLNQLRSWWQTNRSNISRDTVHQFSGKNFNGGTIGIAWVGVICNRPDLSYGLSEDQRNTVLNARLTGHEIGHNLSAQHDDQIGCSGVACNGSGPIMCSFIQTSGSDTFSSCSKSSISNHVHNSGSCL